MLSSEESFHVPVCIELLSLNKSLSKIWIRNIKFSETDHVSIAWFYLWKTSLWVELLIGNYYSFEMRSQCFTDVGNLLDRSFWILLFTVVDLVGFSDLNESYWSLAELFQQITVGLNWIKIVHVIDPRHWTDLDSNFTRFKLLQNNINQFQCKSTPILDRPSVLIISLVRLGPDEWVY